MALRIALSTQFVHSKNRKSFARAPDTKLDVTAEAQWQRNLQPDVDNGRQSRRASKLSVPKEENRD